MTDPSTPQLVADLACEIGENPLWHPDSRQVYFLDIGHGRIHAHSPDTGATRVVSEGPTTGAMVVHESGDLLLLQDGRIARMGPDGKQRQIAAGRCPGNERFNDAIVDPEGRLFTGAYGPRGALLRFDLDGRATEVVSGVGVPNGMGFTPDLRHLYFTDSVPHHIYVFDYDRASGALSDQRVFATIPEDQGIPDGMAMDVDGGVWTAVWFGARIKRFLPDGRLDREVHFPVRQTCAVTFGGADLSDIYVTTAAGSGADSLAPRTGYDFSRPRGGGLYRLRVPGVHGRPAWRCRVRF